MHLAITSLCPPSNEPGLSKKNHIHWGGGQRRDSFPSVFKELPQYENRLFLKGGKKNLAIKVLLLKNHVAFFVSLQKMDGVFNYTDPQEALCFVLIGTIRCSSMGWTFPLEMATCHSSFRS